MQRYEIHDGWCYYVGPAGGSEAAASGVPIDWSRAEPARLEDGSQAVSLGEYVWRAPLDDVPQPEPIVTSAAASSEPPPVPVSATSSSSSPDDETTATSSTAATAPATESASATEPT